MVLLLLAGSSSPGVAGQQHLDLFCSAFPSDLTESDLVARYGAANVRTDTVRWGGEYRGLGTILFPESADARLEIIWWDAERRERPASVTALITDSRAWRAANGVSVGLSLRELEALNGRPFRLAGFWTEASGRVLSWGGGNLSLPPEEECLRVQVQPPYDGSEDFDLLRQVRSGREYSSGHPAMQKLPLRVVSMYLTYGPPESVP